jgi:phage I-like protein
VTRSRTIQLRGPGIVVPEQADLPVWLHLVPYGTWRGHTAGAFTVDQTVVTEIVANFERHGIDLVVDYEHQTLAAEHNGQPAPAAGWIDTLEIRADGLWGHVREWSARAAEYLRAREYRYLSPVLHFGHRDKVSGQPAGVRLSCVALTNIPFLTDELVPVVNRSTTTEPPMMNLLASLIALYALAPDATEADVLERATADHEALAALQGEGTVTAEAVAEMRANADLGQAARVAMKWPQQLPADAKARLERELRHSGYVPIAEHVAALRAGEQKVDALTNEQLIERAMAEGKVTAALKGWFSTQVQRDREGAEAWLSAAPVIVPMHSRPRGPQGRADGGALSDTELAVCRQLGISEKDFRAQAKA